MDEQSRLRRLHWQFSLRGLLVVLTLAGVGGGALLRWHIAAVRQRAAVRIIGLPPFHTTYEGDRDPATDPLPIPSCLESVLTFDHFYRVVDADLNSPTDQQLAALRDLPSLESLLIGQPGSDWEGSDLAYIRPLRRLKQLDLMPGPELNDNAMACIASLPELRSLRFSCGNHVTDTGLAQLVRISKLDHLDLTCGAQISSVGLASLAKLSQLAGLSLGFEFYDKDFDLVEAEYDVRWLPRLEQLSSFGMEGNAAMVEKSVAELAEIPGLRSLGLRVRGFIENRSLKLLGRLHALEFLSLQCDGVGDSDEGLAHLLGASQLQQLWIRPGPAITDAGLSKLASLQNLSNLDLELNDRICGSALGELRSLRRLNLRFHFRSVYASPFELQIPAGLADLYIDGPADLGDHGIAALAQARGLRHVQLRRCSWTNEDFTHFDRLTHLEYLVFDDCTKLSTAARANLRAALPNCQVIER